MIDISVQNIKKAFEEGNDILDGISFDINTGECVGLLGKNGAGKTTLLKIITDELSEDEGNIVIPETKKIGMISQIPVFASGFTAEDVLRTAFSRLYAVREEMEQLEKRMAEVFDSGESSDVLDRYDRLVHEFERSGGYMIETELNRVVNGLQIPHAQRTQRFNTLSGGEKTRINLARLILENTDILYWRRRNVYPAPGFCNEYRPADITQGYGGFFYRRHCTCCQRPDCCIIR